MSYPHVFKTVTTRTVAELDERVSRLLNQKWRISGSHQHAIHFTPAGGGKGAYTAEKLTEIWSQSLTWDGIMGVPPEEE